MGFIDFAKKQWKKHQINEERKSLERQRLNRLARDAEAVGYAEERGRQRARQRVRDEREADRRQRNVMSDISDTTWGLIDDRFKKRKRRKR